jgi:hypothetical protein
MSTAAGRKRLEEVLEETGWKKKPAKSPSPSSVSNTSTSTESLAQIATLATNIKDERQLQEEKWEKKMELKRLEAKEKLDLKKMELQEKAALREEDHRFRRELMLAKLNKRDKDGAAKKGSDSKGLEEAIMALIRVQEQRFNKMEKILEKIADK